MAEPHPNSPEALSREILAEARREADDIIRRAQQSAASLLAAATAQAEKIRQEQLEAARVEAARRSELIRATIPVEAGQLRSARIETILENIHAAARRELLAGDFDYHETVIALAAEALRRIPGTDFILKISASDYATFGDQLAEAVRRRTGRSPLNLTISPDPAITGGGVMVQDAAGIRIWDNRLLSRLERLWPDLRRQIATQTALVEKNRAPGGAA
jgi:vacuolar-type H+-ATPase subunit E/Vma4